MATMDPQTVERAVKALLKWRKSKSETEKPQLLGQDDDFFYLILTLKKIPQPRTNPHKISLPHALIQYPPAELCLFIDDRPKSNLTKDAAMKKIKNDGIPVSKVIKITKLKTDYRPYEAKRKLCDSYDMFFADKRVIPLLPKMLGKQFFKKKKIPAPLDLKHNNWKEQIEKVCSSALLFLSSGTCCVLKVGKLSMSAKEIVENVLAAINGVAEVVPRKWGGIRSLHVKLLDSLALPVYQSVPSDYMKKLKIESSVKDKDEEGKTENLKIENGEKEAKEEKSMKKMKKKKGRIHEVRYMDSNIGELFDEDELGSDDELKGDEGGQDYRMDGGEDDSGGKKRKEVDRLKKLEKPPRKAAKVAKDDSVKARKKASSGEAVKEKKQKKKELSSNKGGEELIGKEEKTKKKKKKGLRV